jgi:phosphopantothenoylcysteine synthetase/decarboxylase
MKIVLGISGSIAAFKAADLASQLVKQGHDVHAVIVSLEDEKESWKPGHIDLADTADLFLVAPATANLLGEFANGLAPDPLTSVYLALPRTTPVLIAPAMNGKMWLHPATQRNLEQLKADGCTFVGPAEGILACGYEGIGRLAEIAEILAAVTAIGKP